MPRFPDCACGVRFSSNESASRSKATYRSQASSRERSMLSWPNSEVVVSTIPVPTLLTAGENANRPTIFGAFETDVP